MHVLIRGDWSGKMEGTSSAFYSHALPGESTDFLLTELSVYTVNSLTGKDTLAKKNGTDSR